MHSKSFTLIEILVVIVVVGILSYFILVGMSSISESANIAKSKAFSDSLRNSLLTNLVSEWKLDEGTETTAYDSWGTNNGTLTNGPTWVTSGCVSSNCLSFDGTDDYVEVLNNATLNLDDGDKGTLSTWIKVNSWPSSGYPSIVTKGTSAGGWSSGSYHISIWSDRIHFVIYENGSTYNSVDLINLPSINSWHYLVMTWSGTNGGKLKAYLNSLPITSGTTQTVKADLRATQNFRIGSTTSYFFNGLIDDIKLYNTAISNSQIEQNYFLGLNKLYKNGGITEIEYIKRIAELKINLTQD